MKHIRLLPCLFLASCNISPREEVFSKLTEGAQIAVIAKDCLEIPLLFLSIAALIWACQSDEKTIHQITTTITETEDEEEGE